MKLSEEKRHAYKLRQKDTGWGRTFAHYIPLYGLYYAISRRTITPLLYGSGLALLAPLAIGFSIGLFYPYDVGTPEWESLEESLEEGSAMTFLSMCAALAGTKFGMNKSREYARMRLKTEDSSQSNPFNGLDNKIGDSQPPMALDQGILAFARRRGVRGFTFNDVVLELGHSPEKIRLELEDLMQKDCLHITNDIEGRIIYREP